MKYLVTTILAAALLAGCTSQEDVQNAELQTKQSFENPQRVGVLPDGRSVFLVIHHVANDWDRYIYFVQGGGTTTDKVVPNGKSSRLQVEFDADAMNANTAAAQQKLQQAAQLQQEAKSLLGQ
jgi:outer membrane protein assembly factor BamE (lipoprotein component of BamABCDE complex)